MQIVKLIEEGVLQKEAENRRQQAFTFGLKLDKNGMPDRFKLLDNLNRVVDNCERLGLTKEKSRSIRNEAIKAEIKFQDCYPIRKS